MSPRESFGPSLRRDRERRGISLQAIADTTKISAALFAAMERNDFSRWPDGIFRRSFLRAYAQAVGLDADRTVDEYLRLFRPPDDRRDAVSRPSLQEFAWVRALAAFVIACLMALPRGVARLLSRRAAPPAAPPPARHVTKRRATGPAQAARRHRPRRSDHRRKRV